MKHQKLLNLILLGIGCGVVLSFTYINPYTNQIQLSELVLQLSGSRGNLALGLSLPELLAYNARLVPYILFEMYIGVNLYSQFCSASVYVFSRTPNRIRWYLKECAVIFVCILIYQTVYLGTAIVTAYCRYEVIWDVQGAALLMIHAVLYALWLFGMTLLVNLISILFGSEFAFAIVFGGQAVLITLLAFLKRIQDNAEAFSTAVNLNPVSHLVLGWHAVAIEWVGKAPAIDVSLHLADSVLYMLLIAAGVGIAGVVLIQKHDLIVVDPEFGGI